MIFNTFNLLGGIGEKLEKRLWQEGILDWDDFLNMENISFISPERKTLYDEVLRESKLRLDAEDAEYFARMLKRQEHWRLFDMLMKDAVCLDIESDGLSYEQGGRATVVGLYNGKEYTCFVRGVNLTAAALDMELSKYKYLITFYGAVFDVPFLMNSYNSLRFDMPHFDLCFGAKRVGLHGGLKKIEPLLGIDRPENVKGIKSYDAVLLWHEYRRGNDRALELLIEYNKEDTVNLLTIAKILYGRLRESSGIDEAIDKRECCGKALE